MAKDELTPEEEDIRQQLVKIAADNDIYFVLWYGHCNNYFVGLRNSRKKEPEIYAAMYEMVYDVAGADKMLFRRNLGMEYDWPNQRLPWKKMLKIAKAEIVDKKNKEDNGNG